MAKCPRFPYFIQQTNPKNSTSAYVTLPLIRTKVSQAKNYHIFFYFPYILEGGKANKMGEGA